MNAFANTIALPAANTQITSYVLATDGACSGNPGPGGWGVAIIANSVEHSWVQHEAAGGDDDTTSNRMEMMAAIEGLKALVRGANFSSQCPVTIRSDSKYLVKGFTEWMPNWKRNGWRCSNRKPVMNRDLWEALDAAASELNVTWTWVKGHSGDPLNEMADQLAKMGLSGTDQSYDTDLASAVRTLLSDRGVTLRNNKKNWINQLQAAGRVVSETLDYALKGE